MSGYAQAIGGGISAIGAIGGGIAGAHAAKALVNAGNTLYNNALGQYGIDQTNLNPYISAGSGYANALTANLPQLSQGFDPTQQQLENSPGYRFQLQQGLEAAQNGFAARGLGVSGAAMKGAANFATGLADSNYTNLANVYNTNRSTTANILTGGASLGMNAAGTLGSLGMNALNYEGQGLEFAANGKVQGALAPWQGISAAGSDISGMGSMGSIMGGGSK